MNEKIINRIKKMFALANNEGATPGEAENAMRMANNLLEKYNLQMMDLHTQEDMSIRIRDYNSASWVKQVNIAVSEIYSCVFFMSKSNYTFVGTESNLVTCMIVSESIITNINKAGKGKGADFRNGAALELVRQCREIMSARRASTETTGTGIVLSAVYDKEMDRSEKFIKEMLNINLTTGRSNRMKSSQAGRDYGSTLNPHAHLSNKKALN